MSIVRGCPTLRGPVLTNMAVFLAAIPDDTVQVRGSGNDRFRGLRV